MKRAITHIFSIACTIYVFLILWEAISIGNFDVSCILGQMVTDIWELPVLMFQVAIYYVLFIVIGTGLVGTVFIVGASNILLYICTMSGIANAGALGGLITAVVSIPLLPLKFLAEQTSASLYAIFYIALSIYYIIFCILIPNGGISEA